MNRKCLLTFLLILLMLTVSVKASANIYPKAQIAADDLLYDAVFSIESSQLALTDNLQEQVKILLNSSDRLLSMVSQANDQKQMTLLLDNYQQRDGSIWELWESLEGEEAQAVADVILDVKEERSSRLKALLDNYFLPDQARERIAEALENQERAMKKQEEALEKAQKAREKVEQVAVAPGQTGSTPGQSGSSPPGQSDSPPGQSGSAPGQTGSTPGQSGSSPPGQSGSAPGQTGSTPGQSGSSPPGQSGSAPGLNKDKQ